MNIDPVYLREVLGGLLDGTITHDKTSLPLGVNNVFARWTSEWSRNSRHSIDILRTYALLKGPLSPESVSFLMNGLTELIRAAINDNAHLFNQEMGQSHILFHDRFRIYVLAESSYHELQTLQLQIYSKLKAILQLPQAHTSELQDYAFRNIMKHGVCSDIATINLLGTILDANLVKAHENYRLSDGWRRIRVHFQQLRIRERYANSNNIVQICLREFDISQIYSGQDVMLSNGLNSLGLDNQYNYPLRAALALCEIRQGDSNKSRRWFQDCVNHFQGLYGESATLTDAAGDQDSYEFTRELFEHLVAKAANQNDSRFVFRILRFIDEFSWSGACRAAMTGACSAGHYSLGLSLLKWLSDFGWNPEEEHPLEVAGRMGAKSVVLEAEDYYADRWFLVSSLQRLSIYHLSNHQPQTATNTFQKMIASIKDPKAMFREADQPLLWILIASVLARTDSSEAAFEKSLKNIQTYYLKSRESTQRHLAQYIHSELGQLPRTSRWTAELLGIDRVNAITNEADLNLGGPENLLKRCLPNLDVLDEQLNCPADWPHRILCTEKLVSSTVIHVGLALEWWMRGNDEIGKRLGLVTTSQIKYD